MCCLICPTYARFSLVSGDFGPQREADGLKQSDDEMMMHGFLKKLSGDFFGSSNVNLRILSYFSCYCCLCSEVVMVTVVYLSRSTYLRCHFRAGDANTY